MTDNFRLAKGRWKVVTSDGKEQIIESDGTHEVNMKECLFAISTPLNPASLPKSQPSSGETSSSPSPSESPERPI